MSKRSRAGVTLIELLIAVTLVSLLSVGMLLAIRVGLNAMERANANLMADRRVAGTQRILEQQLAGLMPAVADCLPRPGAPPQRLLFFQGEPAAMRFVSSYSMEEAARGYPRILEFAVIPGANQQGVRLIVNEHLYTGPRSTGMFCLGLAPDPVLRIAVTQFQPIQPGPRSFVLADRLAFCRFFYREVLPPPLFERWTPRWVAQRWPSAVRVELRQLSPNPARVPLLSITVPIRVDKDLSVTYAD